LGVTENGQVLGGEEVPCLTRYTPVKRGVWQRHIRTLTFLNLEVQQASPRVELPAGAGFAS
jgi:hypothetical protein